MAMSSLVAKDRSSQVAMVSEFTSSGFLGRRRTRRPRVPLVKIPALMFDAQTLFAFLLAGTAIVLAPGPAQALVLSRTLAGGREAGLLTAVGLNAATLVHAIAAGLGLSAVLARSALAFTVVKLVGACYLIYLGVRAIVTAREEAEVSESAAVPAGRAFGQAFVTGLLNPKVALFFLAFLPQFIRPTAGSVLVQALVLGGILAALDLVYEAVLVSVAVRATAWLSSPRTAAWRSRVTGTVLIGLGARLAFAERR